MGIETLLHCTTLFWKESNLLHIQASQRFLVNLIVNKSCRIWKRRHKSIENRCVIFSHYSRNFRCRNSCYTLQIFTSFLFFISCIRQFKAIFAMVGLTRAASVAASVMAPTVLHTMIGFGQISTKNNAISKFFWIIL